MIKINQNIFANPQIHNFIWDSFYSLGNTNPHFLNLNEYKLFYFIIDDFTNNLNSLRDLDINRVDLPFPYIKKNTRHMIEAYLDLYNLCCDSKYEEILNFNSKLYKSSLSNDELDKFLKEKLPEKYFEYAVSRKVIKKNTNKTIYKNPSGYFSIKSKAEIAQKVNGFGFGWDDFFKKYCDEGNCYIHPDTHIQILTPSDLEYKKNILKEYLNLNLKLLDDSFKLFINKFNNKFIPTLPCYKTCLYRCCSECYNSCLNNFMFILNNSLFFELPDDIINFYQR